ncbi:hypothetical protein DFJ73DRAFT_486773 [Zopfochytrium polystomum]|nr:hypothetical protein DFJ73DRAFT_486773 [Zopfochytrium polystomum]
MASSTPLASATPPSSSLSIAPTPAPVPHGRRQARHPRLNLAIPAPPPPNAQFASLSAFPAFAAPSSEKMTMTMNPSVAQHSAPGPLSAMPSSTVTASARSASSTVPRRFSLRIDTASAAVAAGSPSMPSAAAAAVPRCMDSSSSSFVTAPSVPMPPPSDNVPSMRYNHSLRRPSSPAYIPTSPLQPPETPTSALSARFQALLSAPSSAVPSASQDLKSPLASRLPLPSSPPTPIQPNAPFSAAAGAAAITGTSFLSNSLGEAEALDNHDRVNDLYQFRPDRDPPWPAPRLRAQRMRSRIDGALRRRLRPQRRRGGGQPAARGRGRVE